MWPRGEDPDVTLRRRLGSALLYWWEPRAELVTKSGSNVTGIVALAGGANFALGSGALVWTPSGPGGRPFIAIADGSNVIEAPTVSIPEATRSALYTVVRFSGTALTQHAFVTRAVAGTPPTGGTSGTQRLKVYQNASGQFGGLARFTGGTQNLAASGASDANWHAWSIRPLAAGASWRKDGAEVSPTFASTDPISVQGTAQIGQGDGASGGDWACSLLVDVTTNPTAIDQAVRDYIFQRFGLVDAASQPLTLDQISVPATNAYSCCRKLRAAYAGAAFRVRRDSDNTEQDIGFAGVVFDQAALLAFVGAGSGYVVTLYDQSGNGRDLIQATVTNQPRIVNVGVPEAYPSGQIAMLFDGAGDRLARLVAGNTTGLTGNPNITMGAVFQITNTAVSSVPCGFGDVTAATGTTCVFHRSTAASTSMKKQHGNTDRNWTLISQVNTAGHAYVMQHTAGGNVHSGSMRQNGAALAQGSTTGSAVALNLADTSLNLGANVSGGSLLPGKLNTFILFNAVLAGTDLAALETELAAHV